MNEQPQDTDWIRRGMIYALLFMTILIFLAAFTLSSGCITLAKNIAMPTPEPTVVPTTPPTEIPTPTLTPTPVPTPDWSQCSWQDQCYHLREWHRWFRVNVTGINTELGSRDLATQVTVYDYKIMPNYHYHEPLWGSTTYFKQSPAYGHQYVFIFINIYSNGDDARQYGYAAYKFNLAVKDRLYLPEEPTNPANRIRELDFMWDLGKIQSPHPYGYEIIQEKGSGIITAKPLAYIFTGRDLAWDGYLIYEVPIEGFNIEEVKVSASFDNLGGNAFWKLV